MTQFTFPRVMCVTLLFFTATIAAEGVSASDQMFKTLVEFNNADGAAPLYMSLIQGTDGSLYGTTGVGGAHDSGTVFKLTQGGALVTLYDFCAQTGCTDGGGPRAGLVLGTDGNFYGTTSFGGSRCSCGTVFKITSSGALTTLHYFEGVSSVGPSTLSQNIDGNFYGTTGLGDCLLINSAGCGTVFKISPSGTFTTLYTFCAQTSCADGYGPAGMVQATDGNFYGTTSYGGVGPGCDSKYSIGCGTVFRITPAGKLTSLYSFSCTEGNCRDGQVPEAGLVQATDGCLYGTTYAGGNDGHGTIFRITTSGSLATLYGFNGSDAAFPTAAMIQGTDGNLYGTTSYGGVRFSGAVIQVSRAGGLKTLYSFCPGLYCVDGATPYGGLLQATDGNLYGSTNQGGNYNCGFVGGCGTVFRISTGLSPFVAFVRGAGRIGQTGGILGQGFTGTTAVSLNGIPASFTVESDTYLTATVPVGATSGYVTVTTPTETLTSSKPFIVIP